MIQRVVLVVKDGQQPVQRPPLHHHLKGLLAAGNDRVSFLDQFVQFADFTS